MRKLSIAPILLGIYILSLPLGFVGVAGLGSISKLLSIIPILYFVIVKYQSWIKFKFNKCIVSLFLFLFISSFSVLYSVDGNSSISRLLTISLNFFLVFLASQIDFSENEKRFLVKCVLSCSWLCYLILCVFGVSGVNTYGRTVVLIGDSYQDPNEVCSLFFIGIVIHFFLAIKGHKRLLNIVGFIILFSAVLRTGSRGGLLSITGGILCLIIYSLIISNISLSKKISVIIIILVFIILMFIVFNYWIPTELKTRLTISNFSQDRGSHRLDIWEYIIEKYKEANVFRKIFGFGTGTCNYVCGNVAHNIYLENLLELGIVGVLIFLGMYFTFLKDSYNNRNIVLWISMISCCITGLTLSTYRFKVIFLLYMLIIIFRNNPHKDDYFYVLLSTRE